MNDKKIILSPQKQQNDTGMGGFRAFMLNQPDTFRTGLHASIQRKEML